MNRDEKVVLDFPKAEISSEENVRRQKAEAERLANLAPGEWQLWIDGSAERLGIPRATLEASVKAIIAQRKNEQKKEQDEARREQARQQRRTEKERIEAQRKHEREQGRLEKDAARKRKEMEKAFKVLIDLPTKDQDARLADLAKRLDEDVETIRAEFAMFVGSECDDAAIEPWAEPVDTGNLLAALQTQISRYVVIHGDGKIAVALWVMFAWVHNEIATHSPYLIVTSTEPDSGKTTLLGGLGFLVPSPFTVVELTGPGLYRIVDHYHPTLIIDEADDLFHRKNDLRHIVNAGWTRGTKIPRMVRGVLHEFDPFCPKIIGLKGMKMPNTTASRSVGVKLWPKKPDEEIAVFTFTDDEEFLRLRRKLVRWSADNAATLKDLCPAMPLGFNNRLAANWRPLFAIADHAGCLEQAHRAAVSLSRRTKRSEGVRLLSALRLMFANSEAITSAEIVKALIADHDEEWGEFRNRGHITQRQVAALLADYDIHPGVLHPTKRAKLSRRGYRRNQFIEVFARFLPPDPNIRTRKSRKTRKSHTRKTRKSRGGR